MIKVIFIKPVPGVKIGQVKEVSDGYALNYLLPQALAVKATAAMLAELQMAKSKLAELEKDHINQIEGGLNTVSGKTVIVTAKASAEGTLYARVTPAAVAAVVNREFGLKLTKKNIVLPGAIKAVGDHTVELVLGPGKATSFIIRVEVSHGEN